MCLQDPADATNDLGKKGFAIKHIQATLEQLEKTLRHDIADNTRPSLLAPLVGSAYMLNKERRAILEEYGASVEVLEELATEEAAGEMTVEKFKEGYAPHLALTEEIAVEDVEGITKEALLDAVEEVEEEMEAEAATEKIAADETHGAIEDKPKVLTSDRTAGRS
jgi:non-canonical poly(A) RNA polymerase PAPD5/7